MYPDRRTQIRLSVRCNRHSRPGTIQKHKHKNGQTHTHSDTNTDTHRHTHTHTHTLTQRHTDTHIHTYTPSHTQTQTHRKIREQERENNCKNLPSTETLLWIFTCVTIYHRCSVSSVKDLVRHFYKKPPTGTQKGHGFQIGSQFSSFLNESWFSE